MGNTGSRRCSSLKRLFPNFRSEDWVELEDNDHSLRNSSYGNFRVLKNSVAGDRIDRYEMFFLTEREKSIYQQCFLERLREDYLVNAFHYEPICNKGFCSTTYGAMIYIQHIPVRLSDITDIPFPENLYILKCSLLGFEKLYNIVGYFEAEEDLVCIDREGHIRVWMNADLSKNYPQGYEEDSQLSKDSERMMVSEVLQLIEKNTSFANSEINALPLSEFFESKNNRMPSFRESIELLQLYIRENGIDLPHYCESVIEIFQEEYGEDFDINYSDFDELENLEDPQGIIGRSFERDEPILEPLVVHYEAPEEKRNSSRQNSNKDNILFGSIEQQEEGRSPLYYPGLNKGSFQKEDQNWKNESLKSSLKFAEEGEDEGRVVLKERDQYQNPPQYPPYNHQLESLNASGEVRGSKKLIPVVRFSYGNSSGRPTQTNNPIIFHNTFNENENKLRESNSYNGLIQSFKASEENSKGIWESREQETPYLRNVEKGRDSCYWNENGRIVEVVEHDISGVNETGVDDEIFKDMMKLYPVEQVTTE